MQLSHSSGLSSAEYSTSPRFVPQIFQGCKLLLNAKFIQKKPVFLITNHCFGFQKSTTVTQTRSREGLNETWHKSYRHLYQRYLTWTFLTEYCMSVSGCAGQ